ncbi:hypothetical protein [Aquiflexum gelatinilyticum]|uniref:Uncharacterized protein n=1 Tax=Aquiflexum gelatinilyticum TaxID=2961943 RepID=A0A9X2P4S2_9BACT|nr:hypothetical protein [Aquiflexum gelatinilyticum]MCR9015292.1 hypothetical protein [Aquiflexum gelatinilyticum]
MKKFLTPNFAANGILLITSATLVFHFLILFGIIPFENTWGGRLENREQMIVFESISILITILVIIAVAIRIGYLNWDVKHKLLSVFFYILSLVFGLNTLGNIFADNDFEKFFATPLTLILAIFCWRLAKEK